MDGNAERSARGTSDDSSCELNYPSLRRKRERLGHPPEGQTLEQWEDEMIREALRRANGNKSQAARLLGLSRNALRYRLSKIGIADDAERNGEKE